VRAQLVQWQKERIVGVRLIGDFRLVLAVVGQVGDGTGAQHTGEQRAARGNDQSPAKHARSERPCNRRASSLRNESAAMPDPAGGQPATLGA
jgi:hypothetical protein